MIREETATVDEIRVPIKLRSYRAYRNIQAYTAIFIGMLFVLLCYIMCSFLSRSFTIPLPRGWLESFLFLLFWGIASGMMVWSLEHLVAIMNQVLAQNLPALIINQNGIIDNASDNPAGLIRWNQIKTITLTKWYSANRQMNAPGIAIILNERNRPKPGPMMLFFGFDLNLPAHQVLIRQEMIGKPASEVVKMANEFRARMN